MECNKEEAIRAKGIAEYKMRNKDFIAAKKIVHKAQQLYPGLDNVSQMLTVCEVHCSAENKVNGEMDWYGILQVQSTTDELTIKKQYRKLALLLHPDKNKFGGAEAAFKLVGEAHVTLTDKLKRAIHDVKRRGSRTFSGRQPVPQTNRTSTSRKQPTSTQSNGFNQQPSPSSTNQTFWTICTSCGVRYKYYQIIMNRAVRCQICKSRFITYDINAHPVPSQQEKRAHTDHFTGPKSNFGTGSNVDSQGNVCVGSAESQPGSTSGFNAEFVGASNIKENVKVAMDSGSTNDVKLERAKLQEVNNRDQAVNPSTASRSQKRGRTITVEPSESESDIHVVWDNYHSGHNTGTSGSCPQRSSKQKHIISHNEDQSDDDCVSPKHKKVRIGSTPGNVEQNDPNCVNGQTSEPAAASGGKGSIGGEWAYSESLPNGLHKRDRVRDDEQGLNAGASSKASASVDFISEALPDDTEGYSYPDPEFCNFEGGTDESKFSVDQIWAIYDDSDAMPRYYALIRHVYGPKFKLRFNWLEYEPTSKAETLWHDGGLPTGCGIFKLGKAELTHKRLMFSHLIPRKKGTKKNTYDILPRKGEVWAVFKNWDIEWSSCVNTNGHYEYEIVEVISDFTEGHVISVVRLVKVHGFVSLFVQAIDSGSSQLDIQCKDILRFSHSIPSYRLQGNEREGIPKGSLELDCASLPLNFANVFPSVSVDSVLGRDEDLNNACNGSPYHSAGGNDDVPTGTTNKSCPEVNGIASGSKCYAESEMTGKEEVGTKEDARDPSDSAGRSKCFAESEMTGKEEVGTKEDARDPSDSAGVSKCYAESETTCTEEVGTKEDARNPSDSAGVSKCYAESETMCTEEVGTKEDARDPSDSTAVKNHTVSLQSSSIPNWYDYPDSEFHDFEVERLAGKFEEGQIWALYNDVGKNPNYYGHISKVKLERFEVHVTWLDSYSEQENEKCWFEGQLPVGCGIFNVLRETVVLDTPDAFSHLVHATPTSIKNHYTIYPRIGEIWAVYKNWSIGWSLSDHEKCDFDLVEIFATDSSGFKVTVLSKVEGYTAVFKAESGIFSRTMHIPFSERLKFSHEIPSFRLTGERGGKLRGYWELDPAAVPEVLRVTDST